MTPQSFRSLLPSEYYGKFLSRGIRADGRMLSTSRSLTVKMDPIHCSDASVLIHFGGTTAIAALSMSLVEVDVKEASASSLLTVSVVLPAVASPRFRSAGALSNRGQAAYAAASDEHVESAASLNLWITETLTRFVGS